MVIAYFTRDEGTHYSISLCTFNSLAFKNLFFLDLLQQFLQPLRCHPRHLLVHRRLFLEDFFLQYLELLLRDLVCFRRLILRIVGAEGCHNFPLAPRL
jgi:hypothetical protein